MTATSSQQISGKNSESDIKHKHFPKQKKRYLADPVVNAVLDY